MVVSVIQSQISATDLTLTPGVSVASFTVDVVNGSDRQASFYILLNATGDEGLPPRRWYRLEPTTSSKVPPGTRSHYHITLEDTPLEGFVGLANLTVRIISPELQSEERHVLRLRVEPGASAVAFKVELPATTIQDYPGQTVEIPARVHNSNRNPVNVALACPGIDTWVTDASPKQLYLLPNRWQEVVITCQIPADYELSQSQEYPFQVLVVGDDGAAATADGILEVLPLGYLERVADTDGLTIPATRQWWPNRRNNAASQLLSVHNQSNLRSQVNWMADPVPTDEDVAEARDCQITLEPEAIAVSPGQTSDATLTVQVKRPWCGWFRTLRLNIKAQLADTRVDLRNDSTTLPVRIAPVIPVWAQFLAALLLMGAIAGFGFLNAYRQQHRQLVNTVQFNGIGSRVMSGSSDQTVRQWRVGRWGLQAINRPLVFDKAVRVLQYRPVDNNQIIVGLENGEIQLWDLLPRSPQPLQTLVPQNQSVANLDDRAMALAMTADAQYLFSGYGSGLVSQWYVAPDAATRDLNSQAPIQELSIPEMAIYDIGLVGVNNQTLAVAGRYNKLLLWNWASSTASDAANATNPEPANPPIPVNYPEGGQNDYITSLSTAEQHPFRLATADNQGRIIVWDLQGCLEQSEPCQAIDQWQITPNTPVRDIALSANGCYLASATDDGRITLWFLTERGRRLTKYLDGQILKQAQTRFNSVDIKIVEPYIYVTSGAEDATVRSQRLRLTENLCRSPSGIGN